MFEEFVAGRCQALQRFGYALTGDWALAEDLLQTVLAKAYPRWSRIRRDDPEAYVRKIMVNTWSSWWRASSTRSTASSTHRDSRSARRPPGAPGSM